ncbi:nitroreductase family deazaflavin-dependent oxidoreductase [Streptomyces sp. SP17KL33]|uniref:nitroreductase family deazaflavin-dependent oxidoreductase n=1 Tax=Streptomyces sp. SP17KL33 TaxID=3002534 RepID=UPI002E78B7A6|nr:nitroreductase family deazaflavin-dependent oxidoreductase [Streptomyces sp. SP17KL33]MEE1830218.1 nitroreductase family deazaflavin-dependent oxidoreductase [Streptomyces sp. SP17KL33]
MDRQEEIADSPNEWVAQHIRRYLETNGQARPGMNDLLLTTRGRKSGKLRRTALVYVRDGDRYILAASNAGADQHPAWYLNLAANPNVTVQIGPETFPAAARTATSDEKPRLWELIVAALPSYQGYQEATSRDIPVVIIDRTY